VKESCIQDVT
jgi:hypothetical protein